jgi:hypothetical protein
MSGRAGNPVLLAYAAVAQSVNGRFDRVRHALNADLAHAFRLVNDPVIGAVGKPSCGRLKFPNKATQLVPHAAARCMGPLTGEDGHKTGGVVLAGSLELEREKLLNVVVALPLSRPATPEEIDDRQQHDRAQ